MESIRVKISAMDQNEFVTFETLMAATLWADRQRNSNTGLSVCIIEPAHSGYYISGEGFKTTVIAPSWDSVERYLAERGYQLS